MGDTEATELTLFIENDGNLYQKPEKASHAREKGGLETSDVVTIKSSSKSPLQLDREIANVVPLWRGGR